MLAKVLIYSITESTASLIKQQSLQFHDNWFSDNDESVPPAVPTTAYD